MDCTQSNATMIVQIINLLDYHCVSHWSVGFTSQFMACDLSLRLEKPSAFFTPKIYIEVVIAAFFMFNPYGPLFGSFFCVPRA